MAPAGEDGGGGGGRGDEGRDVQRESARLHSRVAGGQDYEVQYEAKKTGKSAPAVKKAVKKVGNARKRVEKRLGR